VHQWQLTQTTKASLGLIRGHQRGKRRGRGPRGAQARAQGPAALLEPLLVLRPPSAPFPLPPPTPQAAPAPCPAAMAFPLALPFPSPPPLQEEGHPRSSRGSWGNACSRAGPCWRSPAPQRTARVSEIRYAGWYHLHTVLIYGCCIEYYIILCCIMLKGSAVLAEHCPHSQRLAPCFVTSLTPLLFVSSQVPLLRCLLPLTPYTLLPADMLPAIYPSLLLGTPCAPHGQEPHSVRHCRRCESPPPPPLLLLLIPPPPAPRRTPPLPLPCTHTPMPTVRHRRRQNTPHSSDLLNGHVEGGCALLCSAVVCPTEC